MMTATSITNIAQLLINNAKRFGEKPAIIHKNKSISYQALANDVQAMVGYFTEQGLKAGDKFLIFVPMSIDLYKVLLAVFHLGGTAVFLDAWSTQNRLEQALSIVPCQAFVGIPKAHLLRVTSKAIAHIPHHFMMGISAFKPKQQKLIPPYQAGTEADAALITFTTGSTGLPKAAKRTHQFLLEQHAILSHHLKPTVDDVDLSTLPIFVLHNLAVGMTSVIPDFDPRHPEAINPKTMLNTINQHRITSTVGSPIFYDKLADYCLAHAVKPKTLERIFLGGAPVFPRLAQKLIQAFPETVIEIVYGSTEAEPISSILAEGLLKSATSKGLLVGTPSEAIALRIVQPTEGAIPACSIREAFDHLCLPVGAVGEICVAGKHVLTHYFNSEVAQKLNKIEVTGTIWHRTGDAGYLDAQGQLFLMGRLKQKLTVGGKDYYLFPIENSLLEVPAIELGTLIKVNQQVVLVIELKKGVRINRATLKQTIDEQLKLPQYELRILAKIPRDPRHHSKIDYDKLKSLVNLR
jgi:olefin beta-lactone synthetase